MKDSSKMKKIGIITLVRVNNFGAELQAFATQHALQLMGHDSEIIDYHYFTHPLHKKTKGSKPSFSMPLKLKVIVALYPWYQRFKRLKQCKAILKRREDCFESFHKENTKFSKEYRTAESLETAGMDYDAFVVGSDQVWNPNNYTSLDPYFLKFAPQNKRRISYASSFGVSVLPEHSRPYYREALRGLNAVGVREENAIQLVDDVAGVKAQWVIDPTLLLTGDEWIKYGKAVEVVPENFVLIYEVTPCSYVKKLAQKIAADMDYKVVRINGDALRQEADAEVLNVMAAGPAEFIWLFNKAKIIVTNSFHGTAFSLNLQKDFFVVTPKRKKNNSRQKSLLRLVTQEDRLLVEGSPMPEKDKFRVDYSTVNPLLAEAREKSINYLKGAIDGE